MRGGCHPEKAAGRRTVGHSRSGVARPCWWGQHGADNWARRAPSAGARRVGDVRHPRRDGARRVADGGRPGRAADAWGTPVARVGPVGPTRFGPAATGSRRSRRARGAPGPKPTPISRGPSRITQTDSIADRPSAPSGVGRRCLQSGVAPAISASDDEVAVSKSRRLSPQAGYPNTSLTSRAKWPGAVQKRGSRVRTRP